MVTPLNNAESSSSFLTANIICRGTIRCFLLSFAAFPANSNNSAVKYSKTDAKYTGAPPPIRREKPPCLMYRAIRPTGNCNPATAFLKIVIVVHCLLEDRTFIYCFDYFVVFCGNDLRCLVYLRSFVLFYGFLDIGWSSLGPHIGMHFVMNAVWQMMCYGQQLVNILSFMATKQY
eukprot:526955_1